MKTGGSQIEPTATCYFAKFCALSLFFIAINTATFLKKLCKCL